MFKFLEQVFGVVFTNKIRLLVWDKKRSLPVAIAKSLLEWYLKIFREGNDAMQFYLIMAVVANLFILSGFFAFIAIAISDFILFRIITRK